MPPPVRTKGPVGPFLRLRLLFVVHSRARESSVFEVWFFGYFMRKAG
jgi:hypothetical protein